MLQSLAGVPDLRASAQVPLSPYSRFGIGGPAAILAETASVSSFLEALRIVRQSGQPFVMIAGGSNLIVADEGFPGIVVRYAASGIRADGTGVSADSGAELQALVDFTIGRGLKGIETLTRIPGWVGGAVYGNAGAYGRSISEVVRTVSYTDGEKVRTLTNAECEFRYRESIFKRRKDWIILSTELALQQADAEELRRVASEIERIRDQKFPPSMKCAGSIFKNLLIAELPPGTAAQVPEDVIRDGKIPAAWFLEQVGAKGMAAGAIRVADYHANLIYNDGGGTARDLRALIAELKSRVHDRFDLTLEEEVQYIP
ncbi:MAG: UDP-N-acetylmuramate dehydrogenase [Acidobacteriales bacterium]|nr:MAG: UDP-N-acetylmuramate dehydrogenase [Terriglobales bacterium]